MPLALPGITRQPNQSPAAGVEPSPIDRIARDMQSTERVQERRPFRLLATEGSEHHARSAGVAQRLAYGTGQNGMWPDLEKDVVIVRDHLADRRREQDGLPDISPPVLRIPTALSTCRPVTVE